MTLQRGTGRVTVESVVSINDTVLRKQLKTEDLRRLFGVRAFNKRWPSWSVDSSWLRSLCTWSAAEVSWLLWDQLWVFWGSFSSRHLCLQFCAERSNLSLEAVYWSLMHWDPWCLKSKDLELRSLQDELAVFLQALAHETWRNKHNKPAMLKQQLQQFWTHGLLS